MYSIVYDTEIFLNFIFTVVWTKLSTVENSYYIKNQLGNTIKMFRIWSRIPVNVLCVIASWHVATCLECLFHLCLQHDSHGVGASTHVSLLPDMSQYVINVSPVFPAWLPWCRCLHPCVIASWHVSICYKCFTCVSSMTHIEKVSPHMCRCSLTCLNML